MRMDSEPSGFARFIHPVTHAEREVQLTCLVDLDPEQPRINLGATRGYFMEMLEAAGLRLPQELEDVLYWNGAMFGMNRAYVRLERELGRQRNDKGLESW